MLVEKKPAVTLISLPWANLREPSLELGTLSACLQLSEIQCTVKHLNLYLPKLLLKFSYNSLSKIIALNDFLFSGVFEPEISSKQEQWLRFKTCEMLHNHTQNGGIENIVQKMMLLRNSTIPNWLTKCAEEIVASGSSLVVMTCETDQTIASLALARLIRKKSESTTIVLTGKAIQDPTGQTVLTSFHEVDAIINGESEPIIEDLAKASIGQIPLTEVPNLLCRNSENKVVATKRAPLIDLDSLPIPDYDDYFNTLAELAGTWKHPIKVDRLPVENARGCWWGQTKHCTSCNMMEDDLNYRYKHADRVIHTMDMLHRKYHKTRFRFADNIFPYNYYNTLLPQLIDMGSPYAIKSNIKVNIKKDKFLLLAKSGFDKFRIGFDPYPHEYKKKHSLQNIYFLLLGKRLGVPIRYNFQFGLPNEDPHEISDVLKLIPLISHLDAPYTKHYIQITRYSPMHVDPEKYGISPALHDPSYHLIFSSDFIEKTRFNLNHFCHYFYRNYDFPPKIEKVYAKLDSMIDNWISEQTERDINLWFKKRGNKIDIIDTRKGEKPITKKLNDIEAKIYQNIMDPITVASLQECCAEFAKARVCNRAIKRFRKLGIIFQENEHILALALEKTNG